VNPLLLASVLTALAAPPAPEPTLPGSEWPAYKGNAGLTGVSGDDTIRPPFKLAWTYRLDGDASSDAGAGVTVAGGKVFVNVHNTRSILALDARTGRFVWEYKESAIGYKTAPTYADGRLYLLQRQAKKAAVVALDAATGKEVWRQPLKAEGIDPHRAGLPVLDGKVFCSEGGEEPAVIAFDAKTGKEVWRTGLGKDDGTCAVIPVAAGGTVFVGTRGSNQYKKSTTGATVALDAATGKERWRRKNVYPYTSLASDGKVVACAPFLSEDERFHLLDANTGETLWQQPRRFHYTPTTITPELVLIKPYGGEIVAADRETGKTKWQFNSFTSSGCCSPVVAGGFAYVGTGVPPGGDLENLLPFSYGKALPREQGRSGTLHAIDLKTGKSVWYFGTGNTICGEPALAYGRLYFASRDGCVYCFLPVKEGEPTTPEAKDKSEPASKEAVEALLKPELADKPRPGKDWPMLGANPDRTGLELPSFQLPLEAAWKLDTGGRVVGSAAVRDGTAFVGSDSGKLFAVELTSGKKLWEFDTGGAVRCSPAVAGGLVYCGSDGGDFFALEAATGKKKWNFTCGGPVRGSPVVAGGIVIFGANDHNLYALDRANGRKLWSFRADQYCVSVPPIVHGDRVFCAQWSEIIYALDLKTGKEQWRSFLPVSVEALSFYRDKLWVRNVHYLLELDPATGKRLRLGSASWGWGGMAFQKSNLFVSGIQSQYGTNGGTRTDLDQPGKPIEKFPTLEGVLRIQSKVLANYPELASMGTPLVVGDQVCFATVSGKVVLAESDGKERWKYQLGGTCHATPIAADGYLLVGCDDGHLYAFRQK
jgi:outer membrane protein assembly factor BamB